MAKMTACLQVVSKLQDEDRDTLLARLDEYQGDGVDAKEAQQMAARDAMAELEAEREEFMGYVREQHGDLFKSDTAADELAAVEDDDGDADRVMKSEEAPVLKPGEVARAGVERKDLTEAQRRALINVTGAKDTRPLVQKVRESGKDIAKEWRERAVQWVVDQYAPIKKLSPRAYMLARMSAGADGTLEAALLYGKPYIDENGVADVKLGEGGFVQVLAKLGGETETFLHWIAAQRARELMKQGKENLYRPEDIETLLTLNQGKMPDGRDRADVYAEVKAEYEAFNAAMMNVSVQSGLITPKLADYLLTQPYVPFYRDLTEGGAPMTGSALTGQEFAKKLKGGYTVLGPSLLENVLQNWAHILSASAKNRAALATVDAAIEAGVVEQVPLRAKGSVTVTRDGVAESYFVSDPALADAMSSFEYVMPQWMRPLTMFKRWLTIGVTTLPGFKVKNLLRDSIQSVAISPLGANPLKNVAQGLKAANFTKAVGNLARTLKGDIPESFSAETQTYASMLAGGGLMRFGTMIEGNRGAHTKRMVDRANKSVLLDADGARKLWLHVGAVWDAYQELGDTSEQANRIALYEQLVKKGHSHAEAAYMARDLLDFSMSGKAGIVRFLTQTVPFLNARLQGLYKLGRGGMENQERAKAVVGSVMFASLALMLLQQDDEDWKKRQDWDRDSYWWFKIGDTAFRIPKPFEVGALGTIAERTWEVAFNDDMTMRRYGERIWHMVTQTFAFNPTPQVVKPLIDVYANRDSFSGRNIEGVAMRRLREQDRYDESTSEIAKALGHLPIPALGDNDRLSPQQIDYLFRAYFGTLGAMTLGAVDLAVRPLTDKGEAPTPDYLKFFTSGLVTELPSDQSRYVQALYDRAEEVSKLYASHKQMLASGDKEGAAEFFAENRELITQRSRVEKAKRELTAINKQIKVIEASKTLSAEAKRAALTKWRAKRNAIAERAEENLPAY